MSLESALDSFCFICMPIEPVQSDRSRIEQTKRALRVQNCFEISSIGSAVDQQLKRRVERELLVLPRNETARSMQELRTEDRALNV